MIKLLHLKGRFSAVVLLLCGIFLTSIGAAREPDDKVRWSKGKEDRDARVQVIVEAAKAIADLVKKLNSHHPVVRFSSPDVGGVAVVPLWPYDPGSRCSPNFDLAPFNVARDKAITVRFDYVNIQPSDQARIAFAMKADKPGRPDQYRLTHDVGNGSVGNKPSMKGVVGTPTDGDYAYYFLDRGEINTDEILRRNPGAAIRITIAHRP